MPVTRRAFLAAGVAGVPLLSAVRTFGWQSGQTSGIRPTFSSIRGNVGTMVGRGGTIAWLITGNGNVVVDTQYPEMAAICLQFLAQQSKNQELKAVINTHHHADHTSGNATMQEPARQIVAHHQAVRLLKTAVGRADAPAPAIPDTTFTNDWALKVGHEELELRHYGAAHTSGDAIITFTAANVAHLGDLVFNRRHPYIDRAAGGTIEGWIQVLRRVVSDHTPETEYIFGHASEGFPIRGREADVNHMRDYLIALRSHVTDAARAGTPLPQLIKTGGELKGFGDFGPLNEHVLAAAFDEFGAQ